MTAKRLLFSSLFLLLLISSLSIAFCPTAERRIYLAAVTGENSGGVFQLVVDVKPGTGQVYTAISPRTGIATQESEDAAVGWAFTAAGMERKECDVFFRIDGNFGQNTVDGPSAGGAMTVATHAALTGKSIRQDVVMTGAILPGGRIGEVGGVIEKSIAASDSGAKYFLAPKLKVYESFLLASVGRQKDFTAIEIANVSEAEEVMFSDGSQEFSSKFSPKSGTLPEGLVRMQLDTDTARFSKVASDVVDILEQKVDAALAGSAQNEQTEKLRSYFRQEILNYRTLISMGYPFTAANAAFLLSIDAEYVKIGDHAVDLDGSIEDVTACVKLLSAPVKNSNNFDIAVGSDLRRIWAEKKLNETVDYRSQQGGYTTLRDLLFSYGWCGISRELSQQAGAISGEAVDEPRLSSLSSARILEAEDVLANAAKPDYDAIWHYESALVANRSGLYAAAIYESTYAETMQKATSGEDANISASLEKLAQDGRKSFWAKVYYAHGMYLYQDAVENGKPLGDAYRILRYSSDLDRASADIQKELAKKPSEQALTVVVSAAAQKPGPTEQDPLVAIFLAVSIAIFGMAIIYRLVKGRKKLGGLPPA